MCAQTLSNAHTASAVTSFRLECRGSSWKACGECVSVPNKGTSQWVEVTGLHSPAKSWGVLWSLLGLLHDGTHGRNDSGLGAAGTGGDSDHCWQGGCGGEDGGLRYCRHGDGRVPFALPLLGICDSCAGSAGGGGRGIGCGAFLGACYKLNFRSLLLAFSNLSISIFWALANAS